MNSELGAVLFDMDGVIIDSARVANRLLVETAARHGAILSAAQLRQLAGASGLEFWSYVKSAFSLPSSPADYLDSYDAEAEVALYDRTLLAPGIETLLDDLTREGLKTAVVTSATCWRTRHVLALVESAPSITAVICGDDTSVSKPDPAPYLLAAQRLDLPVHACLAVDDSARGIRSATDAGMRVLAYTGFGAMDGEVDLADGLIIDFRSETAGSLRRLHWSGAEQRIAEV